MTQLKVLTITTGKGLKCGGGGDLLKINKCCQTLQIKDKGDFFSPFPALMWVQAQWSVRSGSYPTERRENPEWGLSCATAGQEMASAGGKAAFN